MLTTDVYLRSVGSLHRLTRVTYFTGIAVASVLAANAQIYVSPNGDDHDTGTKQQPVRTLERARDLVRTRNRDMHADITVFLEGGTYRLDRTLELDQRDSGTNGHAVVYAAVPGETPVISGAV